MNNSALFLGPQNYISNNNNLNWTEPSLKNRGHYAIHTHVLIDGNQNIRKDDQILTNQEPCLINTRKIAMCRKITLGIVTS